MNWIKASYLQITETCLLKKKQKQFGILLLFFLLLFLAKSIYSDALIFNKNQLVLSAVFIAVLGFTVLKPKIFYPFLVVWMFFGAILGEITSFLIFAITYFLVLSPIVLAMKLANKKQKKPGWINKTEIIDYKKLY